MRKDIEIPIAKNVHVAIVHEWNEEFLDKEWNAYVINERNTPIETVIAVSNGYESDRRTSTMRHGLGDIAPRSFKKIEVLQENLLAFNNEFFVTYFADNKLYEKRFLFEQNTVSDKVLNLIPIIEKDGVLAK